AMRGNSLRESLTPCAWRRALGAVAMLGLLAASVPSAAGTARTGYLHANLIDTARGQVVADVAIVVAGGRIESVTSMADYRSRRGVVTHYLRGAYVLPGLINSHVHLATSAVPSIAKAYLRRELSSGVTAVRDM